MFLFRRRKKSMSKNLKTHEVEIVEFSNQVPNEFGELTEVKEKVLQVIDQEGNKWYFKHESLRNSALWQWKVDMALEEDAADERMKALSDTRRWVQCSRQKAH